MDCSLNFLDELAHIDRAVSCWGRDLFALDSIESLYGIADRAYRCETIVELICVDRVSNLCQRCTVAIYLIACLLYTSRCV